MPGPEPAGEVDGPAAVGPDPRVRFAPSPTGYFHVGSARTALFNWLVARGSGGTFVLRIEDTDTERNREEHVEGILGAMRWLGMAPDEGPYRQSARFDRYAAAVDRLWDAGALYACTCTHAEVEARNKAAGITTPGYDGHCRHLGLPRVSPEGAAPAALRFRVPDDGATTVSDVIRGEVVFPHSAMDDFVAVKSTGQPLFVLANVVDDIDMAITEVIRGEDLLPTTPRGVLLWQALSDAGWKDEAGRPVPALPAFAHLPMLVNEKRQKLSKRRDPVAVEDYRRQGFLPEAFVNYLALLGWSPKGGEELFAVDQLVRGSGWRTSTTRRPSSTWPSSPISTASTSGHCRWRSSSSGAGRGSRGRPHRGRRGASIRRPSPGWPPWCRSGWPPWARCRPWSTSSFSRCRPWTRANGPG